MYRFGLHDSGVIRWGYVFSLSVRDALRIGLVRGTAITWCVCVCLSVNPNPNDVLGIRQYIAKYRDITIPLKLGRSKTRPSIAKLSGNVYMWVGVAGALHNSDVTIVT